MRQAGLAGDVVEGGGRGWHDRTMTLGDGRLNELAAGIAEIPGVVGVVLGGSRARGDHTAESDVDVGLYYRPPLDVSALGDLAREVGGVHASVTMPGEWGPWVDGGAWLTIEDTAVDWIYRELDRVHASWRDACKGRYRFHGQAGHPLGVPDFAYAGEIALGVVLADPTRELSELQRCTKDYPEQLGEALVAGLWEASFLVENARRAMTRGDSTYIAGCLFRVVGVCAHALHGHAGCWLIHEKGAVPSASRLPGAPLDFASRAHRILGELGTRPEDLAITLDVASGLVRDTAEACQVVG